MDFLETAAVLIPSLTGLAVTIHNGDLHTLAQFESKYCFSPDLQAAYTVSELMSFIDNRSDNYIYELIEPLETHLLIFKWERTWILIGPYVEVPWNDRKAKLLLAKVGWSDAAFLPYKVYRCELPICESVSAARIAELLIDHASTGNGLRKVKTIYTNKLQDVEKLSISETYEDCNIVIKRYSLESDMIDAVSRGADREAIKYFRELHKLQPGLKFISNHMKDQLVGAAALRAMMREGAKRAGLTSHIIDSISQEYAQKMHYAATKAKIDSLLEQMLIQFCELVRREQGKEYSIYVRKAVHYIDVNFSKEITIKELTELTGISHSYFVQQFGQETGMTVKQYITQKRCEAAAELLLNSQLSVAKIAEYVGYLDNNYFSRIFKSTMGKTPKDYRKHGA